jgi:hypothetical protein
VDNSTTPQSPSISDRGDKIVSERPRLLDFLRAPSFETFTHAFPTISPEEPAFPQNTTGYPQMKNLMNQKKRQPQTAGRCQNGDKGGKEK